MPDNQPLTPQPNTPEQADIPSETVSSTPATELQSPAAHNESILQAAAAELNKEESATSQPEPGSVISPKTPKKSHKKLFVTLAVIVFVLLLALGVFIIFGNKADAPQTSKTTQNQNTEQVTKTYEPNTIPYAFRANSADPFSIYYRPAASGERKEVTKLARDEIVSVSDTRGATVVFGSDTKLYVSDDAGKTFDALYEAASGEAINSVKISSEGNKVSIAIVPDFSNQSNGSVISVDLNGKNKKELFSEDTAIYLIGWSEKKNSMAYWLGCYACDGGRTAWKLRDLKADTAKDLVADINPKELPYEASISADMSTLVYVQPTYDDSISVDGPPGYYAAAPYRVQVTNLTSGKTTTATTVGTKDEKNTNGTDKLRVFSVGFLAGTNTPFYAEDTNLFQIVDGKPSKIYQADQSITEVLYASKDTVIAQLSSDVTTGDFILSTFDIANKKSTQILQGDANTTLFGVTTK